MKDGLSRILNDLDSAGREEERGTRRKEGRGGGKDEESEKNDKVVKKMKNEKVAKRRIIGLAGPCFSR